jgi:acyl-CoA hydrolase/GNAT superfamily N-acetyltransferase
MRLLPGVASRTWRERCVTAEAAIELIPPGASVFVGSACATPVALVRALAATAVTRPGVELLHVLADTARASGDTPLALRQRVFHVGTNVIERVAAGRVDYVPVAVNDVPSLIETGRITVDVALVQVSPPDVAGRCSLGVSVEVAAAAVRQARIVLAEINPAMPRTGPNSTVPYELFDATVAVDEPVAEYTHPDAGESGDRIARYVARLVDDGATIQAGLGRIPTRVLGYLDNRRDLGIHTDVLTDPIVDLVRSGAVTGSRKSMSRGRIVASLALGTRRLYDFLDDNPAVDFRPIDEVADPAVVAAQHSMVSITQAFSVDLGGQVCAEWRGGGPHGGVSTQATFHAGALRAPQGRALVCLASLRPDGSSAISPALAAGEPVTIPRWATHWVVTEYGSAYLYGSSLRERAVALIELAHPDHREDLLAAAVRSGLVPQDQRLRSRRAYPVDEERVVRLGDGSDVRVRPTRAGDARQLQALFYRLRPQDVLTRFFRRLSSFTLRSAEHLCSVSYDDEMAFAAVVGRDEVHEIVGLSSYARDPQTRLADVAYMVDPVWQGRGLGTELHRITTDYARRHGVDGFTADVLKGNDAMLAILRRSPGGLEIVEEDDRYEVVLRFAGSGETVRGKLL